MVTVAPQIAQCHFTEGGNVRSMANKAYYANCWLLLSHLVTPTMQQCCIAPTPCTPRALNPHIVSSHMHTRFEGFRYSVACVHSRVFCAQSRESTANGTRHITAPLSQALAGAAKRQTCGKRHRVAGMGQARYGGQRAVLEGCSVQGKSQGEGGARVAAGECRLRCEGRQLDCCQAGVEAARQPSTTSPRQPGSSCT